MKTKAELTRKLEQMQEENQSVSKLRESMDQEMDEYRKQKNQILDERDDALRESRNLRKEMEEMKRTIGELEKQIQERDSRELERQLLNQTYQTQSVEDVERTVPVNEGVAGIFAKQVIHCLFIFCDSILLNKCLNGSGKTAAMDTADAAVFENCLADGECQRYILCLDILTGVNVLQIFEGRISGCGNGLKECRDI